MHLCWFDIIDKTENSLFQFKTAINRKVYFARSFIKLAERNFRLLDPDNIHYLVLARQDNPMEPVATRQFNQALGMYFEKFRVETENPSSHTLRKTHLEHAW